MVTTSARSACLWRVPEPWYGCARFPRGYTCRKLAHGWRSSTRDLLIIQRRSLKKGSGFKSLRDAREHTATAHGRPTLIVLGGLVPLVYQPPQAARNHVA